MTDPADITAQARKSALAVGLVLLLIAGWNLWRDRPVVYLLAGVIGAVLLLMGLFFPGASRAFHSRWMRFAHALGHINSRILLSAMFYLVIAPHGVLMKLFGRNTMNRRGPGRQSYWIPRKRTRQSRERFERLF